jgi:hypothetical protein
VVQSFYGFNNKFNVNIIDSLIKGFKYFYAAYAEHYNSFHFWAIDIIPGEFPT